MKHDVHHAVSLFSNCGAGDVGYAKAGFHFDVMAELDPRRLHVCLLNHHAADGVAGDLRETWPEVVETYRQIAHGIPPSLLAACPPCQGMSTARTGRGRENDADAGTRDKRNLLVTVIANVTKALCPRLVVVENVQAFLTRQIRHPRTGVPISAARLLIDDLEADYAVFPFLADLCDFGVPQTRKRTFLTFVRKNEACIVTLETKQLSPYPRPTHAADFNRSPISLLEALKSFKLPSLDASSVETGTSSRGGGLHSVPIWPDRRYTMVAAIPPHTGSSAWENNSCERCGEVDASPSAAHCPSCGGLLLRPIMKARNGRYRLIHGFRHSTYSRMKSASPAATITTASGHIGSNNTIHPFEHRLLSTLECALLQTFPRRFKWGSALQVWGHTNVREMIGEAVPPLFTTLHGKSLIALLDNRPRPRLLSLQDGRNQKASKRLGLSQRPKSK